MIFTVDDNAKKELEKEEKLFNERIAICKKCALYIETPSGPRCNSRLYINETDKQTVSDKPKIGFRRGCNCVMNRKARLLSAHCIVNK